MTACAAELCTNWTGAGCICAVLGIESICGRCEFNDCAECEELIHLGACCCGGLARDEDEV